MICLVFEYAVSVVLMAVELLKFQWWTRVCACICAESNSSAAMNRTISGSCTFIDAVLFVKKETAKVHGLG